jgi:hypothetical protein
MPSTPDRAAPALDPAHATTGGATHRAIVRALAEWVVADLVRYPAPV